MELQPHRAHIYGHLSFDLVRRAFEIRTRWRLQLHSYHKWTKNTLKRFIINIFLICCFIYHYLFMWCVCCVCKWCRFAVWNRTVWSPNSKSKSIFGLFAHRSVRSFRIESTTNVNYLTISNGFCSFAHAVPLCALLFIYRFDIFIYLYCVDMSSHLISKR